MAASRSQGLRELEELFDQLGPVLAAWTEKPDHVEKLWKYTMICMGISFAGQDELKGLTLMERIMLMAETEQVYPVLCREGDERPPHEPSDRV
jgi:hypothetical protein